MCFFAFCLETLTLYRLIHYSTDNCYSTVHLAIAEGIFQPLVAVLRYKLLPHIENPVVYTR